MYVYMIWIIEINWHCFAHIAGQAPARQCTLQYALCRRPGAANTVMCHLIVTAQLLIYNYTMYTYFSVHMAKHGKKCANCIHENNSTSTGIIKLIDTFCQQSSFPLNNQQLRI